MERCICIHGHFYQPPRENPWLETVEMQQSASPYHDWNERVTAECYAVNAISRILDHKGRIIRMVNNYARISYNFGPTLLSWLEANAPDVYEAVIAADRQSKESFSGHGSAISQPYNHIIMPLANSRDKRTQIGWGIRDFEKRFGRPPEGMWLPETAVDLESLEIMASQGIRFTILAPHQASRVRDPATGSWREITQDHIDPRSPYRIHLPSGREMVIFFYDASISRAISFEGLLKDGDALAERLLGGFDDKRGGPQLVHVATDGESYGHHHRFGDMALAYALHKIDRSGVATLCNYGEFLNRHPPSLEVEIHENTSWSCTHGVERWRSDCGCSTGARPGWNQAWRAPMREALDWLRDRVVVPFETYGGTLFRDPWAAREDYICVVLDRSQQSVCGFLKAHAVREMDQDSRISALRLMELQRHAMLMYTSCGWFFDDISGIEALQSLRYACRVIQLYEELFGESLEGGFLGILERAKSNIPEHGDGPRLYHKSAKPSVIKLEDVAAHYAMNSLFEDYPQQIDLFCYKVHRLGFREAAAGKAKLAVGGSSITSKVTHERADLSFAVLHLGDHNIRCGIRPYQGNEPLTRMVEEAMAPFQRGDITGVMSVLEQHFRPQWYSLRSLFKDVQKKILDLTIANTVEAADALYQQIYQENAPLLRYLRDLGLKPPNALLFAAQLVINSSLRRAFQEEEPPREAISTYLSEVQLIGIPLEMEGHEFTFRKTLQRMASKLQEDPGDLSLLDRICRTVEMLPLLPFQVNLWSVQNAIYRILVEERPNVEVKASSGDEKARRWLEGLSRLAEGLYLRPEPP